MNTQSFARPCALLAVTSAMLICSPLLAQYGPGNGGPNVQGAPNSPGVNVQGRAGAPKNYVKVLGDQIKAYATQKNVQIVLDPLAVVTKQPTAPEADTTVDKAMDAFAASITGGSWRKVYIKQAVQGASLPSPDRLAIAVRALDQVEQVGMVLENPTTKKATTYLKDFAIQEGFKEGLADQKFNTTPIYVVFAANTGNDAAKNLTDRVNDLQRQAMQLMMQMDPDQMANAMQQSMGMWMDQDPSLRAQMMGNMMRAGMQMFNNMPPEQRQAFMSEMSQVMQNSGIGGPGGPGGPGPR